MALRKCTYCGVESEKLRFTSKDICEKCVPKITKKLESLLKEIHKDSVEFDDAKTTQIKIDCCLKIIKNCQWMIKEYSSKGIRVSEPAPERVLQEYQQNLKDLGVVNTFAPNLISGVVWSSAGGGADKKTCKICRNREGKAPEEITNLKDGLPVAVPCHDGCRCVWLPKIKSWGELLGPQYAGMQDMTIEEWELKHSAAPNKRKKKD